MTEIPAGTGRIESINVSGGGVPKRARADAWISRNGVYGDSQADKRLHGGPDRAVCIYSVELIEALHNEGHPIGFGTTGENLTVSGLDWALVAPGTVWQAGDAVLEVASYTAPCKTIRDSFRDKRYKRISEKVNPGWSRVYAMVLEEGQVRVGSGFTAVSLLK
ncbi:MAG: MOSC domain-containing protein [Gemmatimonadaceae bacterium]